MQKFVYSLLIVIAFLALNVNAKEVSGVEIPDSAAVGSNSLVLNGTGIRKATMLKVKVYVMGLYLANQSSDAASILANPQPSRIYMQFVRKVGAKKIRNGWSEGFSSNTADTTSIQSEIDTFNGMMVKMHKGDTLILDLADGKTDVNINGESKGTIAGSDFQKSLMAIWLGDNPPNKALKSGILGQ